jgi:cytosine/adenosine deaminase-related metal-dependent hydrolase
VLTPNAVLIHGVGFDTATRAGLVRRGVGLVWCPGSNYFLFGQTASVRDFARAGLLALGNDSRLTGARDLLDELRFARGHGVEDAELESLVTERAARLLQLPDRGVLRAGALADLLVLPRDARLWELRRADLLAVLVRGAFRWGDRDYARELLELRTHCSARIDGRPKVFDRPLAHALRASSMTEPGVEWSADPARAA